MSQYSSTVGLIKFHASISDIIPWKRDEYSLLNDQIVSQETNYIFFYKNFKEADTIVITILQTMKQRFTKMK